MAIENKIVTLKNATTECMQKKIENEKKLGWELLNNSVSGDYIKESTMTFRRDTEIKFYERKKQIENHISKLETIANDYQKQGEEVMEKKEDVQDSFGEFALGFGRVAMWICYPLFVILLIVKQTGFAFLSLGIALFFTLLLIISLRELKQAKEFEERDKILTKIQSLYDEAGELDKKMEESNE